MSQRVAKFAHGCDRLAPGNLPPTRPSAAGSDEGRALTETRFQTLNQRAHKLAQSVIDFVTKLQIWLSRVQESPN